MLNLLHVVCIDRLPDMSCENASVSSSELIGYANGTCYNDSQLVGIWSEAVFENTTNLKRTSASEEYFK